MERWGTGRVGSEKINIPIHPWEELLTPAESWGNPEPHRGNESLAQEEGAASPILEESTAWNRGPASDCHFRTKTPQPGSGGLVTWWARSIHEEDGGQTKEVEARGDLSAAYRTGLQGAAGRMPSDTPQQKRPLTLLPTWTGAFSKMRHQSKGSTGTDQLGAMFS